MTILESQGTAQAKHEQGRPRVAAGFIGLWLAGLGFAWWAVVPALMAARGSGVSLKASAESKLLVALGIWLLAILGGSVFGGAVAMNRVPGAAYAAIVWIAAGIMFHVLRRLTPEQNSFFIRSLIFVGSAQGFLAFAAVMAHPSPLSKFALPSNPIIGGSSGVGLWSQANLAYVDYFGGGIVRSAGLMGTAAWSGGFACLILILLVVGRRKLIASGMSRFKWIVAATLNFSSLYFAYSRVSLAILIVVLVTCVTYRACSILAAGGLLATVTVFTGAVLIFALLPWQDYVLQQDALRPGSSDARFTSYLEGFDAASQSGPLVLIAGNGAKPFLEELGRGAGSESTYVSLLVRGGIIAVMLFVIFLLVRMRGAIKSKDWTAVLLLVALVIHAVVEDLDVGTLTLLLVLIEPVRTILAPRIPASGMRQSVSPA
ncbi:hypothetical protein [Pseudarthrobacter sp. ATCC 49987]|uniref:hypothetical protein n=1 Tax=Pseudarthrobacter sp. ATCC 49987 TaxID=2698204 RepID=UPI00136885D2|nr:hypothetical protein [Pseudarthrobacter sp. ATCC 49987]